MKKARANALVFSNSIFISFYDTLFGHLHCRCLIAFRIKHPY